MFIGLLFVDVTLSIWEDPYLISHMVVPYVQGVQSNGVSACVKHFALNNNEINRHTSNPIVDDHYTL